MRLANDTLDEGQAAVRKRMSALASRFPGALRELDELELDDIRRRTAALDAVLNGRNQVERWMEAVTLFHALTRGALCAKRWLSGRKRVDADVERAYGAAVDGCAFPEDARAWARDLACIASPPRGRLSAAVLARVALQLGTTEREVRSLVFGTSGRTHRCDVGI